MAICKHCGQEIPPDLTYRKLDPWAVRMIYNDIRKKTFLAERYNLPIRYISDIKRCDDEEMAVRRYGNA